MEKTVVKLQSPQIPPSTCVSYYTDHKTDACNPIDIYIFGDHMEEFLDKEALRFPESREIVIKNFVSPEGVCGQIYWNKKDWDLTERPLWGIRGRYGIHEQSMAGKFCNGYYIHNTLINPKQIYKEGTTVYISNASVRSDGISQILDWMKEYRMEWLQASESVFRMLLMYCKTEMLASAGISYIELLNSSDEELCQNVKQAFGCEVVRVWASPLFGYCAYAQGLAEDITVLDDQIELEENCRQEICVSTLKNKVMPLLHYAAEPKAEHVCAGCIEVGGISMLKEVLYFPVEIMNEKVGRVIKQMRAVVDDAGKIVIHFGIRPMYWNWRKNLEQIYRQYLEELTGIPVDLTYVHTCNWLKAREDI